MLTFTYERYRAEAARLHPRHGPRGRALWVGSALLIALFAGLTWWSIGPDRSSFFRNDAMPGRFIGCLPIYLLLMLPAYLLGRWVRAKPPPDLQPYANVGRYEGWMKSYLRDRVLEQFRSPRDAIRMLRVVLREERRFLRRLRPRAWKRTALVTVVLGGLGYMWREIYIRLPLKTMMLSATAVTLTAVLLGSVVPVWKELWLLEWRRRTAYYDVLMSALFEARLRSMSEKGPSGAAPKAA
jgi:hypothetical protein